MGIFNLLELGKEKNEIASFKYEDGLKNLENLDEFFLNSVRNNDLREKDEEGKDEIHENITCLKYGIKIGKYEIGGTRLMNYLNTFFIDSNKFIYWLYNSETNETTTYTRYDNKFINGCNVFYDETKDMLYSTDERAKDNVFMALINMKHYYARNYGTLNGFDFIEDKNLIEWKRNFYEIFGCNLKELHKTGINRNQNKYNTMAKDLIKEEKETNRVRSKKEIIIYIFVSIIGIGVIFLLLVALLYLYDLIYNLIF
jgi:hypothetical protein